MRHLLAYTMTLVCCLTGTSVLSQDEPVFEVTQLSDHIYELTTDGGGYTVKVVVSAGEDGILLVDAGQKETAEALKMEIERFGRGLPVYIISTHAHVEHIGGNAVFGGTPVIIGHKNLRSTLRSGIYLFDEFTDETLPEITFTDSLSLYFNGEEIKLLAFPGCHDNSDIIVWFTGSKIVCVGALSNGSHFPSVDRNTGNVLKYPETVQRLINALPDDVTIIPGHGEDGTMNNLRVFHDMLVSTTEIVRSGHAQGKDAKTLQEEDVLKDWASFECSYVDRNQWIKYLVEGFEGPDARKNLYEPIYYAVKENGAEGAVARYYELKKSHPDEYRFEESALLFIGYKLYHTDHLPEGIAFFELCLAEYPQGERAWMCHHFAGKAYLEMGDREKARENLTQSLALNPDNTTAAELLKTIDE